jgi:tetratricopeptide (TPR) repeat protein
MFAMRGNYATMRFAVLAAVLLASGCKNPFRAPDNTPPPQMAPPVDGHEAPSAHSNAGPLKQASHKETSVAALQHDGLNAAEDAYRREEFEKAEDMFEAIADDTKNRPEVAERARFYQAETLRRQGYYNRLLKDFPAGLYREQATGQMFMIAGEWLQAVRDEIEELKKPEKDRKSRSWSDSLAFVHFDRKLPTFAVEDRALQTLEQVYFNDPTGIYADKALFMLGRVHFHRENFRDSSRFFQQLVETCDRSPLRDTALEMAIVAKNNSTGGANYDARDVGEAMRLINVARATSPTLNREKSQLLDEQSALVRYQQAEKDYNTGEFYRRTGHPGSAWFYYELVIRRYPNVNPWFDNAQKRQLELKAEVDELNQPGFVAASRRFWKYSILGYEVPKLKDGATVPVPALKDLPEPRPAQTLPAPSPVPQDIRPR